MRREVPSPKGPEGSPRSARLAMESVAAAAERARLRGGQRDKAARTDAPSREKSFLARQLEGTGLESHEGTRGHLNRLARVDLSSLPESLREVTGAAQSELSGAIGHYRDGRIDEKSLRDLIGRIGGPYAMYLGGAHYPEHRLVSTMSGVVAELRHINRLVKSGEAASAIIAGARSGEQYALKHLATEATERIRTTPIKDTDVLYLGRDGKVHIDEVKETVNALRRTLSKSPDQLANLASWQDQAPEKRESRIVLERSTRWANLFEKIDPKQPTSPTAADLLIEHRIAIRIGDTTLSPENLKNMKEKVERALRGASEAKRDEILGNLSRISPKDVERGNFQV